MLKFTLFWSTTSLRSQSTNSNKISTMKCLWGRYWSTVGTTVYKKIASLNLSSLKIKLQLRNCFNHKLILNHKKISLKMLNQPASTFANNNRTEDFPYNLSYSIKPTLNLKKVPSTREWEVLGWIIQNHHKNGYAKRLKLPLWRHWNWVLLSIKNTMGRFPWGHATARKKSSKANKTSNLKDHNTIPVILHCCLVS